MLSTTQNLIDFRLKFIHLLYIFIISFLHSSGLADLNNTKKIPIRKTEIKWQKLKTNFEEKDKSNVRWELLKINDLKPFNNDNFLILNSKNYISPKITSFNRSIVFENQFIGPDLTFLVPIGFKSSKMMNSDFSIRGWNRRPKNSKFLAWNNGDAVGQIFVNAIKNNRSSIGLSFGIRSLYAGKGNSTAIGEGKSMGFRWDYQLNDKEGIAIGAEQLVQFDDKTDTGRDLYITYSKAFWDDKKQTIFPLVVLTGGIGTGYFSLWEDTKFACSDLFGGAAVDINNYHQLCWGPFGAASVVFNDKFSSFIEYNNYSFMIGSSYSPFDKIRLTYGITLAESYDDYKFKNSSEIRWFSRLSFSF